MDCNPDVCQSEGFDDGTQNQQIQELLGNNNSEVWTSTRKCLDELRRRASIITDDFSKLSEKILFLEDSFKMKTSQTERQVCKKAKSSSLYTIYITELFNNISLPCVRYIAGGKESKFHKILWVFIHTVALFVSGVYIQDAYDAWQNAPIVQSLVMTKASDIPFPALSICKLISLKDDYDWDEMLESCISEIGSDKRPWLCSYEELNLFLVSLDISHMLNASTEYYSNKRSLGFIYSPAFEYVEHLLPENWNLTNFNGYEYYEYIDKIGEGCVKVNIYNRDIIDRNTLEIGLCDGTSKTFYLAKRATKEQSGVYKCLTFNGAQNGFHFNQTKEILSETFKPHDKKSSTCKPDGILGPNCKSELLYTDNFLELELLEGDFTENVDQTYLVFVHHPFDYPSFTTMYYYSVGTLDDMIFKVQPALSQTEEDFSLLDISKRDCIFPTEKKLSLFDFYTQNNCILECQINCTVQLCGCVPYTIAIFKSSLNVCSNRKSDVCNLVSEFFLWKEYKDDRCGCDCPLDCISLSYKVDLDHYTDDSHTLARFIYEELKFSSLLRYSVTSPAEFVAYSLGILGVFNGFSLLFLIELLYWMTLRLWSTIHNSQKYTEPDIEVKKCLGSYDQVEYNVEE